MTTQAVKTVADQWKAQVNETIAAEMDLRGSRPLVDLVMGYLNLPSSIEGWIAEWTSERGRIVVEFALTQAKAPLLHDAASLVVQYLQKSDIFGLEKLKTAAGGEDELTKLIGKYNPEKPLPFDIDDEMQAPLSKHFDAETLKAFHEYRRQEDRYRRQEDMPVISKMTELYSLYWAPASMTPSNAEELGKKHGTKFCDGREILKPVEYGDRRIGIDCWIAFPNDVFGRGKTFKEQEALIPPGFEFPHSPEAIFCLFVRFASTRERIMPLLPRTWTRCPEEFEGCQLIVGGFSARGLGVAKSYFDQEGYGVAPLRKF